MNKAFFGYSEAIWKTGTGKTLDELWKAYSESPEL